ncbi:hypothetical protein Tco_0381676 [Tanacetum coccineum]
MSTAEAEYVSLSAYCAQVIWMRTQVIDYRYKYNRIPMYCDSKSAISISCNPVLHSKTKHIDIRYHFIKEHVEKGTVEFYFVSTDYQLADLFTKALPNERFEYLVHHIGTDIAKITRKRSKPDKHGHGKGKRIQEPGECYQRQSLTSQEAPIGQNPHRSTRSYWKETHQSLGLCSNTLTKEAQGLTHGLPRWQSVCSSI